MVERPHITIRPIPQQNPLQVSREVQSTAKEVKTEDSSFWGNDGFGFDDLIDIVNPLQHIPVVSSIYRELTGDEISDGARIAGGAILGGIGGAMVSIANTVIEGETGKDIGENILALFESDEPTNASKLATNREVPVSPQAIVHEALQEVSDSKQAIPLPTDKPEVAHLKPLEAIAPELPPALIPKHEADAAVGDMHDLLLQFEQETAAYRYLDMQLLAQAQKVALDIRS
jgi:hypothetical protein